MLVRWDPRAIESGCLSLASLEGFLEAGAEVRWLERLHAKLYLTDGHGLVGSANLTGGGVGGRNRELTVDLAHEAVDDLADRFKDWWAGAHVVDRALLAEHRHLVPQSIPPAAYDEVFGADHASDFSNAAGETLVVKVLPGDISQPKVTIPGSDLEFFPGDCVGGKNADELARGSLRLSLDGLEEVLETDIAGDKKILRRRGLQRIWMRFFEHHHLGAGDRICFERLSHYEYRVRPASRADTARG